jgi:hypothetical protein
MVFMRFRPVFAVLLLVPVLAFAGCGDDEPNTEGGGSDEDYLALLCGGISEFSTALITKSSPDEIAAVIRDFIETMEGADPPGDLREYNDDFVQYLKDSVAEPTSLVTRQPPLPSDDIQRRLAAKEIEVEECRDGTFFSRSLEE